MNKSRILRDAEENEMGGFYKRGDRYPYAKKKEVVVTYFRLWEQSFPRRPSYLQVSRQTKIGRTTVRKFILEFEETGELRDPDEAKMKKLLEGPKKYAVKNVLTPGEENFLLSLRAEDPTRPNQSYINELYAASGRMVDSSFVSRWFQHRFEYKGSFKKSNNIPLDKFREANWFRYYEFRMYLSLAADHMVYNFLDEKHFANHQGHEIRGRSDPVTGILEGIPVEGNFRDAKSIIACVSPNPMKDRHVFFTIGRDTNNGYSFMAFVEMMVTTKFLRHGEVLVMDNAPIHTGGAAASIEDFLWNQVVDGQPLRILVLYLPTRSPELNPIELIFHILSRRMRSFHYRTGGPLNESVDERVARVMDEITRDTIARCCAHCGYNVA